MGGTIGEVAHVETDDEIGDPSAPLHLSLATRYMFPSAVAIGIPNVVTSILVLYCAYDTLGVLPPSVEPRATGHVTQMVDYMQRLIDAGFAYPREGSVYFDVKAWVRAGGDYGYYS